MSEQVLHEWEEGGSLYRLVGEPPRMEWRLLVDGHDWKSATLALQSMTLLSELARLAAENAKLREKILRVRDWLKYEANSGGGICSEIDDAARAEVDK